jgi:hypothetical protein
MLLPVRIQTLDVGLVVCGSVVKMWGGYDYRHTYGQRELDREGQLVSLNVFSHKMKACRRECVLLLAYIFHLRTYETNFDEIWHCLPPVRIKNNLRKINLFRF